MSGETKKKSITVGEAAAASAKFLRRMSKDPMVQAADDLADALVALLEACVEDNPVKGLAAEERARAVLRAAGRTP